MEISPEFSRSKSPSARQCETSVFLPPRYKKFLPTSARIVLKLFFNHSIKVLFLLDATDQFRFTLNPLRSGRSMHYSYQDFPRTRLREGSNTIPHSRHQSYCTRKHSKRRLRRHHNQTRQNLILDQQAGH